MNPTLSKLPFFVIDLKKAWKEEENNKENDFSPKCLKHAEKKELKTHSIYNKYIRKNNDR